MKMEEFHVWKYYRSRRTLHSARVTRATLGARARAVDAITIASTVKDRPSQPSGNIEAVQPDLISHGWVEVAHISYC